MWGEVTKETGEACEKELVATVFEPLLEKGVQLFRHDNTSQSAYDIIRSVDELNKNFRRGEPKRMDSEEIEGCGMSMNWGCTAPSCREEKRRMWEMVEEIRRERMKIEFFHKRQIDKLKRQLQET